MSIKPITLFFCIATAIAINSCSHRSQVAYDDDTLSLNDVLCCNIETSFEIIGASPIIVALETKENSLLPNNSYVAYVTGRGVFISGQNHLYRFGLDGSFKNTIGTIGQGPMEYVQMHNVSFNEDSSLVNIYAGNRKMLVWTIDNKPVREVNFATDGYISAAYSISDGYWTEVREINEDIVSYSIVWFNQNGEQTAKKELYSFINDEAPSYFTAPIVKQWSDNSYFYYDAFSSAGYKITNNGISKIVTVDYGNYGAEKDKLNDMAYREANRDKFCEILDFSYNGNELMLLMVKDKVFRGALVDKPSGICIFSHEIDNPRRNGGIKIWGNYRFRLWPSYSRDNVKYGLIETTEIDDGILQRYNITLPQDYEANPCLVIIK